MSKKSNHPTRRQKKQRIMTEVKPNIPTSNPHEVLSREVEVPGKDKEGSKDRLRVFN